MAMMIEGWDVQKLGLTPRAASKIDSTIFKYRMFAA